MPSIQEVMRSILNRGTLPHEEEVFPLNVEEDPNIYPDLNPILPPLPELELSPSLHFSEEGSTGALTSQSLERAIGSLGDMRVFSTPTWYIDDFYRVEEKPKAIPITPEERYKKTRKELQKSLELSKQSKKIDSVLLPYLSIRDEELLREVLNKTRDLRTYHDLRCWIEEFIINRR